MDATTSAVSGAINAECDSMDVEVEIIDLCSTSGYSSNMEVEVIDLCNTSSVRTKFAVKRASANLSNQRPA